MRIISSLMLMVIIVPSVFTQDFQTELNGFMLGQYREVISNEFSILLQADKYEDGYEYEAYLTEPDSTVYMVFEFAADQTQEIWSIQVTGSKLGYDCRFKGLKLGMTEKEVKDILGKPTTRIDIEEYGSRWEYENTNYTVEINPEGILSSIKLINRSYDFFSEPDISKIPSFKDYSEVIISGDPLEISRILAPDVEIYKDSLVYYFNSPLQTEIETDASGVFRNIQEMANVLSEIDLKDTTQYEENIRLMMGQYPMHVAKFSLNGKYSEIVFKWTFGRYLIWEMKLN